MINLSYQVPISESALVNGEFIIQGTAINETITSNNHKFIAEELCKSADSLTGVPLLVDHENKVENIKGRVLKGTYNEIGKKVDFKAKVMDKICQEMIKDGRLNSVSVGAIVGDVEEQGDILIPKNITFKELSLVAVPADSGATFSIAMKEAYNAMKASEPKLDVQIKQTPQVIESEVAGQSIQTEEKEKICPNCKKPMSKCECEDEEEKCDTKKEEAQQINLENATEVVKDVHSNVAEVLKGGQEKMSEEKVTEKVEIAVVDKSVELTEKLAKSEARIKELEEAMAKKTEEKTEKLVLTNEFEETEANAKETYTIKQGLGYFTLVQNKY